MNPPLFRDDNRERFERIRRDARINAVVRAARNRAALENRDEEAAKAHALQWITTRLDDEDTGQATDDTAYLPWPPPAPGGGPS